MTGLQRKDTMKEEQKLEIERIEAEKSLEMKMWTPKKFLETVEKYSKKNDEDIIDSVLHISLKYEIPEKMVADELMSDRLYYLIREDAERKRMIKKAPTLSWS